MELPDRGDLFGEELIDLLGGPPDVSDRIEDFIESGSVRVECHDGRTVLLGPKDCFGEQALAGSDKERLTFRLEIAALVKNS